MWLSESSSPLLQITNFKKTDGSPIQTLLPSSTSEKETLDFHLYHLNFMAGNLGNLSLIVLFLLRQSLANISLMYFWKDHHLHYT